MSIKDRILLVDDEPAIEEALGNIKKSPSTAAYSSWSALRSSHTRALFIGDRERMATAYLGTVIRDSGR